eukprot:3609140-Amphidinium_carterae.1
MVVLTPWKARNCCSCPAAVINLAFHGWLLLKLSGNPKSYSKVVELFASLKLRVKHVISGCSMVSMRTQRSALLLQRKVLRRPDYTHLGLRTIFDVSEARCRRDWRSLPTKSHKQSWRSSGKVNHTAGVAGTTDSHLVALAGAADIPYPRHAENHVGCYSLSASVAEKKILRTNTVQVFSNK